ncbi:acetyltransferase, GNAT family protein [Roseobacter sp. SK209-2-6]|uniref:GNAT family N-acetyltransferase n=1 Tax=Roseobacter sp. SK209-2-6 TaxID=388739 RepID=UPI0000F3CDB6|nr:GNAT family N-acetyltransferase [Roseobacter sp. SK209-2-6]EBA14847.1 acetyltransferase, GNAT family protein [Roseobacter sp. SK209-2-6]
MTHVFDGVIRAAQSGDEQGMSPLLEEIFLSWNSTRRSDPAHLLELYIQNPARVECTVAEDGSGQILGFQSLQLAQPGNDYDVQPGWGIIGTYVKMGLSRSGIGRRLFAASQRAAQEAGIAWIDATMGKDSTDAQGYYAAMGFEIYKVADTGAVHRRCAVPPMNQRG